MDCFPAFFPLAGKRVVIAGGDAAAEAKARLFAGSPAEVRRIEDEVAFAPGAYAGADLVFVASFDPAFRARASAAARQAGALLNVADAPGSSDFFVPAILDRGALVAAVGTSGAAPLLASMLRGELERFLPEGLGALTALLAERRETIRAAFPDLSDRRAFFRRLLSGSLLEAGEAGAVAEMRRLLDAALDQGGGPSGRIVFVLRPATPDLLSLGAARLLNIADVIIADAVDEPIVRRHVRREAERWPAPAEDGQLAERAGGGGVIAVLGAAPKAERLARLRREVAVEVLRPAPA